MSNLVSLMAKAVRLHRAGQLVEAASLYRHILALDARQPQVHSNLGAVLRAQGKSEEAEALFRSAISLKPDFAEAHVNLANLLMRSRPAEALTSYERAIALKLSDSELYYTYARALQKQGRLADAILAYTKAVALRPQFAEAWYCLAVAHADQNQFEAEADPRRLPARATVIYPGQRQKPTRLARVLRPPRQSPQCPCVKILAKSNRRHGKPPCLPW